MIHLSNRHGHPSDQELLLVADRECSLRRVVKVREHLAQCASCHARMSQLESTLADFISLHEDRIQLQPPARTGVRAGLKAQMSEAGRQAKTNKSWPGTAVVLRQFVGACIALLIVAGSIWVMRDIALRLDSGRPDLLANALPRRQLTPGATRAVRVDDLCRSEDPAKDAPVNASLERQVFTEYGLPAAARENYELDYLITPELGGSTDIHNLWPEPYASTSWNAHVKDELENHLHEMVCQGKLPLATAQREIATDWIAAYKRYFHTETPLYNAASLAGSGAIRMPPEISTRESPAW